jgi:sulfate permease, SulP family
MIPICSAIKKTFKKKYSFSVFKSDFVAAIIVSLAALPLAMALSIAMGLPPEHGIYTAIVAGIVIPLLGGAIFQISGPAAAFVVIIAPIVSQYGLRGLIIAEIMAGIFLVILGISRVGAYIKYIPYPVIVGFTAGIALVIATLALNDFFGLAIKDQSFNFIDKIKSIIFHISNISWAESFVGIFTLLIIILSKKVLTKIPPQIVGIVAGSILAYIMQDNGIEIATIKDRFAFEIRDALGNISLSFLIPSFHLPTLEAGSLFSIPSILEIKALMVPALVIAGLAALESLLSAVISDGMTNTKHDSNSELVAVGFGNILSGFAAGVPATAAIARTATNIQSGAKTPFACVMHASLILVYILFLAPVILYVPMASLAAILLTIAYHMSHYQQFIRIIKIASRSDIVILLICFSVTILVDMVAGIMAAVILSCFLLVKKISKMTQASLSHTLDNNKKIKNLRLPENVMVYHINGALFFANANKITDISDLIMAHIKLIIIDMDSVPMIDMSGIIAIENMIYDLHSKDKDIMLCGKEEITQKIWKNIPKRSKNQIKIFNSVNQAVESFDLQSDNFLK